MTDSIVVKYGDKGYLHLFGLWIAQNKPGHVLDMGGDYLVQTPAGVEEPMFVLGRSRVGEQESTSKAEAPGDAQFMSRDNMAKPQTPLTKAEKDAEERAAAKKKPA